MTGWPRTFSYVLAAFCGVVAVAGPLLQAGRPLFPSIRGMAGPDVAPLALAIAAAAMLCLLIGLKKAVDFGVRSFLILAVLGMLLLAVATWLSRSGGHAAETATRVGWFAAGALLALAGMRLRALDRRVGGFALVAGLCCLLLAVAVLPRGHAERVPAPQSESVEVANEAVPHAVGAPPRAGAEWWAAFRDRASTIGGRTGEVFASLGGLVALLILFGIGWLWLGNRGAVLLPPIAVGGVGLLAVREGRGAETISNVLRDGPVGWFQTALQSSGANLGSAGWAAIVSGVVVSALLLPALRNVIRANLATRPPRTVASAVVSPGILAGVNLAAGILLWIALRRMAAADGQAWLAFLGIPDLAVPHLRPVWHFSYFLLAGLVGLSSALRMRMVRSRGSAAILVTTAVAPVTLALFIPAGVYLFWLGFNITSLVATALVAPRYRQAARPSPDEDARALVEEGLRKLRRLQDLPGQVGPTPASSLQRPDFRVRPASPATPTRPPAVPAPTLPLPPVPPPETLPLPPRVKPQLAGELLYACDRRLVAMVDGESDGCYLLDERGALLCCGRGGVQAENQLPVGKPLGMARVSSGRVVIADQEGACVVVTLRDGSPPEVARHQVRGRVIGFAMNPFGTIVALALSEGQRVIGMHLESGNSFPLTEKAGRVSALGFSSSGRYLAIGTAEGQIQVLDMARRSITSTMGPGQDEGGRVTAIAAGAFEGEWFTGRSPKQLARLEEGREMPQSVRLPHDVSCLAVDRDSGTVGTGCKEGYVYARSRDLATVLFSRRVHTHTVVNLVFCDNGKCIITAGQEGTVRRIPL